MGQTTESTYGAALMALAAVVCLATGDVTAVIPALGLSAIGAGLMWRNRR